jgi:hypothetical protein
MEHLMRMQLAYDLAQARSKESSITVKRYVAEERVRASRCRRESGGAWERITTRYLAAVS